MKDGIEYTHTGKLKGFPLLHTVKLKSFQGALPPYNHIATWLDLVDLRNLQNTYPKVPQHIYSTNPLYTDF
jgi:hypothetical protein